MKMKYFTTIAALFIFTANFALAQNKYSYYIHIQDKDFVPTVSKSKDNEGLLSTNSKVTSFNQILEKQRFYTFEQAFPTAHTDWLREVYYIVCDNDNLEQDMKGFQKTIPLVEQLCEPVLAGDIPNDPYYTPTYNTDLNLIKASEAWEIAKNYPKVNVAITDTYFDPSLEDLSFTLVGGSNNDVTNRHGTFVATRCCAINNNWKGIASSGGYNSNLYVSTQWGQDAEVLRLAQLGYRIINCSWHNRCSYSSTQNALYDEIRNIHNTVVIFSAANGIGYCDGGKVYPASYASCVSVTSVGHKNNRGTLENGIPTNWKDVHERVIGAPNDSVRPTHQHNDAVDICAPGYEVFAIRPNNSYEFGTGTSHAAPQVAGVAAMILAINPNLTANEVVAILKNTADASIYNIPENVKYRGMLGTGRLDAYAAVQAALSTICTAPTVNFTNQTVTTNKTVTAPCDINVQNVEVKPGATLILEAGESTKIPGGFKVELGAGLKIQ